MLHTTRIVSKTSLILFALVLVIGWTSSSALAAATASSTATIDWSSLVITLDPGVDLAWYEQGSTSDTEVFFNGTSMDQHGIGSSGWGDTNASSSYSTATGSALAGSSTSADTIQIDAYAFSDQGGEYTANAHGWGESHFGRFTVTGEGNVTFSVNYAMSLTLNETEARPIDLASAIVAADLYLNYVIDPLVDEYGATYSWIDYREIWYPDWNDPLNGTLDDSGTLTVTLWFADGQQGYFRGGAACGATANSIPEPSCIMLLMPAMLTIAGRGRR